MTMSLLLQTSQSLRSALSALPGVNTESGAVEGFHTALRQAFDTRPTGTLAGQLQAPETAPLDAFRDALTALGIDTDALDEASLGALFIATGQTLSAELPANEERIDVLESMLAQLGTLTSVAADASTSKSAPTPADDVRLTDAAEPAEVTNDQAVIPTSLDEVKARLALVAAFADTPVNAAQPDVTRPAAPVLGEAATRVLDAITALREQAEPNARGVLPNTNEARPVWNAQIQTQAPASFYIAATTASAASPALDGDPVSAPLAANASAMFAPVVGKAPSAAAPGSQPGTEQAALGVATAPAAPTAASAQPAISTPVTSPAFPEKLGQQLIQMTQRGGEQHVKLELHPAELGPLSIALKVSEHGTQAQFFSAHAQVRQVIEQAIPQLREALAEQGIALGETSVGQHNQPNEQAFAQAKGTTAQGGTASADELEEALPAPVNVTLDGRVDLYA
ncbi:flagellar hook-length control protein FliK [Vreelandella sp. EE22]